MRAFDSLKIRHNAQTGLVGELYIAILDRKMIAGEAGR